jgi:hypothetical protein
MAITPLQREICRLIARNRIDGGEAYVAGGVALNTVVPGPRLSHDIDLFHDTEAALAATWAADRGLLGEAYAVEVLLDRPTFVRAVLRNASESVLVEWVCDSAYRFFPLIEHPDFGLVLHPFDLATNKLLALLGRVEVRDWVDVIHCNDQVQPLGYLAWAACGKDPGYGPAMILAHAARVRHSTAEVESLAFDGPAPDAAELSRRWKSAVEEGVALIDVLPPEKAGTCVLDASGRLCTLDAEGLRETSTSGLVFHPGSIRGAMPTVTGLPG